MTIVVAMQRTPGAGTEPTQNLEIPEGQASNGQDDSSKTNTTGVDNTHTDTTKVVDPAPVTTGNGSSASGGSKPDPPLADNTAKDDKAHDGHTAASSPTTQPSQESQPPKAPVTSTDPDQHGHTHDTGSSGAAGPTGPGSTGTGSTGTTNPRSSGTGSTGHQPPSPVPSPGRNNVQSTGSNGTNANKDPGLDLDFKPHADGIGGAYGPNAAPIDPHRTVISEHPPKGPGGPDGPDLTADVLTATTPILLFVASVIVAVLGYSLWKYFAYLGQRRRRTYRTVRDVPSPPLDEEILDHLQRGEPPPDYGYTIIRDRQPASTSGRARPPRVHTRTIIELHLEVLNECEATEWENVNDDYLQILVEEFAQECAHDMIRDANSNNNILGLLTSDYGSPWTNVSANADRPRHYHARHPTCDATVPATHTPTNAVVTDIPTCDTVTHTTTSEDPKPEITDIPTCKAVTDTPTCDHPQPDITDSPTCDTVTHIPTCEDPKPEITQPPGSGNAVTDRTTCDTVTDIPTCYTVTHIPTRDDPKPDITHQLVTDDTVTDTPPHEPPKPAIIHPHTNAPVTDTHTCDHPQPEITDITTSHTTTWLRWIDRNKHLFQACTGQTWFNEIKSEWKQYLREHMAPDADNGQRAFGEHRSTACVEMKKDAWTKWVAKQHNDMAKYIEKDWFRHLLNNAQEETATPTGEVSVVDNDLEVEKVMAAEDMPQVRDVPRSQLHPQPYMKKPLTATLWMLLLASVIEESELECRLQDRELYVDALLEQLCH
ncbi:hypothetical protein AK88_05632 [Plasmodium fragile]|uniref:Schizont-infected cell agglutination C-terminal domain-containing protein n=1 Tax=Plasmodium fragile TaxID=5857 RepID=A0A0D9QD39_PLAFR|nr:uncharacterized protein AK88_05632 [Plasmodium fragile]KJP84737.1 hypothetical protein AK88_05632 [Plasmodium fragile]